MNGGAMNGGAMNTGGGTAVGAAGGRATSAPIMGGDAEPTLFELSQPGRSSWQLRTTGMPEWDVDELVPTEHQRETPVPLAEVSERDLVGHFTRLSHRQFSVDLGAYPLGSCTMKYNPKLCDTVAGLPGLVVPDHRGPRAAHRPAGSRGSSAGAARACGRGLRA